MTGANTGIGRVSAEVLARRGGKVFLGCRSEERARPVLDAIRAAGGFNVHAGVSLRAGDREGLERLCRYASRPPLSLRGATRPRQILP